MGKVFEGLDDKLVEFISAQHIFFVATAPLSADGHVNGVETVAHLRENGRITSNCRPGWSERARRASPGTRGRRTAPASTDCLASAARADRRRKEKELPPAGYKGHSMNRRHFLLASAALAAGCRRGPVPLGGSPQAPDSDADRIREDREWRAENARVRARDWVAPDARRTVPAAFDFAAALPELAARRRAAVLLHPRYSEEPPADDSKVGGTLLWPADEPWPSCETHPGLLLVPVLQLRAEEFPEVGFPPGKDLLQVLWCPREHERCWALPSLFWRRRDAVKDPLTAMPGEPAAYPRYVPLPCRLFPERVVELPSRHELGPLLGKLDTWNEREQRFPGKKMEHVYCEAMPNGGWKVGGCPNWVQAPQVPGCKCGRPMELLLSYASEHMNVSQAPVQEHLLYHGGRRDPAAVENAANAPLIRFIGEGVQFTFVCRRCPGWPVETISQC